MTAKKRRTILSIVAAVEILVLAALGIYAWIEGSVSPQLYATEVKIVNSPGITMLLNGDVATTININEFLADYGASFNMAEASSPDGRRIFIRDDEFNPTGDDTRIFIRDANSNDQGTSYIIFNFTLKPEFNEGEAATARNVWLDPEQCYVRKLVGYDDDTHEPVFEPIVPVRISLTFHVDDGNDYTYIFGEPRFAEEGDVKTYPAVGYYLTSEGTHYQHEAIFDSTVQNVLPFSYFGTNGNPLFSLSEGQTCYMTVRIWLEGADPLCVDDPDYGTDIAGATFDLSIFFTTIE